MGFKFCKKQEREGDKQYISRPTWVKYYLEGKRVSDLTREEITALALDRTTPKIIGDLIAERVKKEFETI